MNDSEGNSANRDQERLLWLSPVMQKLIPTLRKGPFHCTSIDGLSSIMKTRTILPNDGNRPFTFGQSENSYAVYKKAISLFDFNDYDTNVIECELRKCWFIHKPVTMIILLDRDKTSSDIIPNEEAKTEVGFKKMWIPKIECWYPTSIPTSFVTLYIAVCGVDDCDYELIDIEEDILTRARAFEKKIKERYPDSCNGTKALLRICSGEAPE